MAVVEAIKERPILFSAPMVRAILNGQKTQTRRVIKQQPTLDCTLTKGILPPTPPSEAKVEWFEAGKVWHFSWHDLPGHTLGVRCPYGQPGDRLWVRETFAVITGDGSEPFADDLVRYRADAGEAEDVLSEVKAWKPSIFMSRCYSRINLEIVSVRVERLREMSNEDARAEGIIYADVLIQKTPNMVGSFAILWDSINGKTHPWHDNPWVWCITFKKLCRLP